MTLDDLADAADMLLEEQPAAAHSNNKASSQEATEGKLSELRDALASLLAELRALRCRRDPSSRSRRRDRSRSPSPHPRMTSRASAASRNAKQVVCWYHARFGDRARRCEPPCHYQGTVTRGG